MKDVVFQAFAVQKHRFEAQGLSNKEQQASLDAAIEELVRETPKDL